MLSEVSKDTIQKHEANLQNIVAYILRRLERRRIASMFHWWEDVASIDETKLYRSIKLREQTLQKRGVSLLKKNVEIQGSKHHKKDIAFALDYYRKMRFLFKFLKQATGIRAKHK